MIETGGQSNPNPVNPTEPQALRLAIRDEVKEIEEREKRKSSIVVKGLEVASGREFVKVIEECLKYILNLD